VHYGIEEKRLLWKDNTKERQFPATMALVTGQNDGHRPTRSIMRVSQEIYYLFVISLLPLLQSANSPICCVSSSPARTFCQ
jgi:hypothetical protein